MSGAGGPGAASFPWEGEAAESMTCDRGESEVRRLDAGGGDAIPVRGGGDLAGGEARPVRAGEEGRGPPSVMLTSASRSRPAVAAVDRWTVEGGDAEHGRVVTAGESVAEGNDVVPGVGPGGVEEGGSDSWSMRSSRKASSKRRSFVRSGRTGHVRIWLSLSHSLRSNGFGVRTPSHPDGEGCSWFLYSEEGDRGRLRSAWWGRLHFMLRPVSAK